MSTPPSPLIMLGGNAVGAGLVGLILNALVGPKRTLTFFATAFATTFIGFGINAMARPENALSWFEWDYPAAADVAARQLVDRIMFIYGARDIFMGVALYAAAFFGSRRALGAILVACSAIAGVDGVACRMAGQGEWGHWGYAPVLTVVGALLMR